MTVDAILIVDDSPNDQEIISRKLINTHAFISVEEHLDGAWRFCREKKPDFILLDLALPCRFQGPPATMEQLLEFVREFSSPSCLVILTGDNKQTESDQFYAAGAADYILKSRILEDNHLRMRVELAMQLHNDLKSKKESAPMQMQVAMLRSNQDRVLNNQEAMMKLITKNILVANVDKDKDERRKYDQAYSAGKESAEKEIAVKLEAKKAAFWKRAGLYTGGIAAAAIALREFISGFFKAITQR